MAALLQQTGESDLDDSKGYQLPVQRQHSPSADAGITKKVGLAPPTKCFEVLVAPQGLLVVPGRQKTFVGGACPTFFVISLHAVAAALHCASIALLPLHDHLAMNNTDELNAG